MFALFQRFMRNFHAVLSIGADTMISEFCLGRFFKSEDVCLEVVVVEAVEEEVQQIRNDCLSTFRFQQLQQGGC